MKKETLQKQLQKLEEKAHAIECSMEYYWDSDQESKAQKCFIKLEKIKNKMKELDKKLNS
jgi:hypothetical protein